MTWIAGPKLEIFTLDLLWYIAPLKLFLTWSLTHGWCKGGDTLTTGLSLGNWGGRVLEEKTVQQIYSTTIRQHADQLKSSHSLKIQCTVYQPTNKVFFVFEVTPLQALSVQQLNVPG